MTLVRTSEAPEMVEHTGWNATVNTFGWPCNVGDILETNPPKLFNLTERQEKRLREFLRHSWITHEEREAHAAWSRTFSKERYSTIEQTLRLPPGEYGEAIAAVVWEVYEELRFHRGVIAANTASS